MRCMVYLTVPQDNWVKEYDVGNWGSELMFRVRARSKAYRNPTIPPPPASTYERPLKNLLRVPNTLNF